MRADLLTLTLSPLLFAASCAGDNAKIEERPNILFIFADDWGYGDLGCYGNTEAMTPNLDQFATEGTLFTQFHTASGVSSPSRTAVITGHYPARHGIHGHLAANEINERRGMPNWLDVNIPVLMPKMMQEAGYVTAHYGKWHLGGGGEPNGDLNAPHVAEYGYDDTRVWNGNGPTWKGDQKYETTRYMDSDTLWVHSSSRIAVDETLEFLKKNKDGEKPMFINLWLKDPHTPLHPTDEQREPYKGFEPHKETYYAVLTDADYHIGRLLDELKEMGLEENTIVIFSSDNGPAHYNPGLEAGSTAGLRGRKASIFQGGVDVPFIVRWPGHIEANKVNSTSVLATVDLLPTFCDIAGIELPDTYEGDGESFGELFETNEFERTKPLFWDWRFTKTNNPKLENWAAAAVRYGDWKLVADENQERVELHNIAKDPFERNNLAEANPEITQKLLKMWNEWESELPK